MIPARVSIAMGVGLALADASIVTLGLPAILTDLDSTVEGVAAVLGVYTLVLAAALIPAEWLRRRVGAERLGVAGFALFAIAGGACAVADSLSALLLLRALQALGAAAGLVCGFDLLTRGEQGRQRLWTAAAILGTAAGPALGGVLTQLFDWRAIFVVQAPIGALAALACARTPARATAAALAPLLPPRGTIRRAPIAALALVSAALSGVLFLLVLLLVSGWSISPLGAAATVSVLPAAALLGARIPGAPQARAGVGCALVAAGLLPLAFLTSASVGWTLLPMVLAGLGMGLALTSLVGHLLPERTPADTALLLAVRHGGITLALLLLAPITAAELDQTIADTRERGVALVLDAELPPLEKLRFAGTATGDLDPVDPRGELRRSLDEAAAEAGDDAEDSATYAQLAEQADDALVRGIDGAFRAAFLVSAAFALLGALALLRGAQPRALRTPLAFAGAAFVLAGGQALASGSTGPEPIRIADPCEDRDTPDAGGLGGFVQGLTLDGLDRAACQFGSSREELALALVDEDAAREFESEHDVDPRSIEDLARGVLGF